MTPFASAMLAASAHGSPISACHSAYAASKAIRSARERARFWQIMRLPTLAATASAMPTAITSMAPAIVPDPSS